MAKMQTAFLPLAKVPNGNPFIAYLTSLSKTAQHSDLIWKIPIDMNQALLVYRRNRNYPASKTTSVRYLAILKTVGVLMVNMSQLQICVNWETRQTRIRMGCSVMSLATFP